MLELEVLPLERASRRWICQLVVLKPMNWIMGIEKSVLRAVGWNSAPVQLYVLLSRVKVKRKAKNLRSQKNINSKALKPGGLSQFILETWSRASV